MRSTGSFLVGLVLLAGGSVVAAAPSGAHTAVASQAAGVAQVSSCKALVFLGARGSGQAAGFGEEVETVRSALQKQLPQGLMTAVALNPPDYDAPSVSVLKPSDNELALILTDDPRGWKQYEANRLGPYMKSIDDGATAVYRQLVRRHDDCPYQRFVLAGYSQGAMVMHRAAVLLKQHDKTAIMDRVSRLVLIGDGDRENSRAGTVVSDSEWPNGKGIAATYLAPKQPMPGQLDGRTEYVCNKSDIVCDFSDPWTLFHYKHSSSVHTSYSSALLKTAAREAASHILPTRGIWTPEISHRSRWLETSDTDITSWVASSVRPFDYFALKTDGVVWGYRCDYGECTSQRIDGMRHVTQLVGGFDVTIAVKADGSVWTWGSNRYGLLGNGSRENTVRSVPRPVPGLSGIRHVDPGWSTVWAVDDLGQVWVWGEMTTLYQAHHRWYLSPHLITAISDVVQLADNGDGISALKSDGTVWSWGCGHMGQTGDGNHLIHYDPELVTGMPAIDQIVSYDHSVFALDEAGGLWRWGSNWRGQLGLGDAKPFQWHARLGGPAAVKQLTVAWDGSLVAMTSDKAVWIWGNGRRLPERQVFANVIRLADGTVVTRGWKPVD